MQEVNNKYVNMKSGTVILEVLNKKVEYKGFYNPAIPECKKGFRTENGLQKAICNIFKFASNTDWIKAYKIKVYEGAYEYYKDNILLFESEVYTKQEE